MKSSVTFTFIRKVRIDNTAEEEEEGNRRESSEKEEKTEENERWNSNNFNTHNDTHSTNKGSEKMKTKQTRSSFPDSSSIDVSKSEHSQRLSITMHTHHNHYDDDEGNDERGDDDDEKERNDNDLNESKSSYQSNYSRPTHTSNESQMSGQQRGGGGSGANDVKVISLQQEIEDLRKDLKAMTLQRDSLRDELEDLRIKYEITEGERYEFLRQVWLFVCLLID